MQEKTQFFMQKSAFFMYVNKNKQHLQTTIYLLFKKNLPHPLIFISKYNCNLKPFSYIYSVLIQHFNFSLSNNPKFNHQKKLHYT